jgi:hypothetical protein
MILINLRSQRKTSNVLCLFQHYELSVTMSSCLNLPERKAARMPDGIVPPNPESHPAPYVPDQPNHPADVPPGDPPNPQAGLRGYKRDIIVVGISVLIAVIVAIICYHSFLQPPAIDWNKRANEDIVTLVYTDAYWFHELYMRWTVVDWFLTFLATGTALSAVLKNSVSVRSGAAADLSKWDLALIVLALCAVLGSTFDSKLHAGTLADRYRAGDLVLQEAQMDYAGSAKGPTDKEALRKRWHDAQSVLEAGIIVQDKSGR